MKVFGTISTILNLGVSLNAEAGLFGFGGTSWKEEVLLHDGSKVIVDRSAERGGRHEIGQKCKSAFKRDHREGAANDHLIGFKRSVA
jgi:hypothetical protein